MLRAAMLGDDKTGETILEHLIPPLDFTCPLDGEEFAALLVAKTEVSSEDRSALCESLVRDGCRHVVVWGEECEEWVTAVDEASALGSPAFKDANSQITIATSHEDEPLEDVIDFFYDDTAFEAFSPENFVVLVIGGSHRDAEEVQEALDQRTEKDEDEDEEEAIADDEDEDLILGDDEEE